MACRHHRSSASTVDRILHEGWSQWHMRHDGFACISQKRKHCAMHSPHATMARLMVVDDATDLMSIVQQMRSEPGYEVGGVTSGKTALVAVIEQEFDLCLVDLILRDMDGLALLTAARAIDPHMVGIIMTRQGAVETAVEAIKAGAFDYVVKPLQWQTLIQTLSRALDVRKLRMENLQLREAVRQAEATYRSER